MVLMRRAGTDSSVLSNTNPGNGSGWRRRLESSEQGRRQQSVDGGRRWTQVGLRWVVRAQLRQDWNSGHEGEGVECEVACWPTPPPPPPPPPPPLAYIESIWAAEESSHKNFSILSEFSSNRLHCLQFQKF